MQLTRNDVILEVSNSTNFNSVLTTTFTIHRNEFLPYNETYRESFTFRTYFLISNKSDIYDSGFADTYAFNPPDYDYTCFVNVTWSEGRPTVY